MQVFVQNKQKDLKISLPFIKKVAKAVVKHEGKEFDEVSIQFVTTKKICELHDEFFNDPTTTDCISFPMDDENEEGYKVLGEVFVCPKTALDYVETSGSHPLEEVVLYVIHGLLHLMGYDDLEPKKKALMRKAEKKHLTHLKKLRVL